ncbi:alkaline-phosphatase-like protein [Mycena leptocephala]|nr:alkaline-phosphatase-like protein [Mycena leptocephala]
MSRYNSEFPFAVAFPPQATTNVLAEWLAAQGSTQAHIAETEKYAHVTFFNGGVEAEFKDEERHMWRFYPHSVQAVADTVAKVVESNMHDFVMCNFALPDMPRTPQVGHKGNYDSAGAGYVLLMMADHGNAEQLLNAETGAPHTAHTCNPVPFILAAPPASKGKYGLKEDGEKTYGNEGAEEEEENGALCDVAPTVLDLMGCRSRRVRVFFFLFRCLVGG